jgi:hypothetical protein
MSKRTRLSRDQKRKQKLAKRQRRQPQWESQAYAGNRYKTAEFVEPLCEAEKGIYDLYVISGREITDEDVEVGLEELIDDLRSLPVSDLIAERHADESGVLQASIPRLILNHWEGLRESRPFPARDDLIGILRTILGSLEVWRSRSASSRGYLNYLEGFLNRLGYRVEVRSNAGEPISAGPQELYEVGEMWLAGSLEARHRFTALADELLQQGQSEQVVNACQRLLGTIGSPTRPEFPILSELSIRAQKEQQKLAGPQFAPGLKNFISRLAGW